MTSTRRLKNILRGAAAAAFWIIVWALCARAVGKELILPGPLRVARTLVSLAGTEAFWRSILTTFLRILTGYLAGVMLASVLAVLTCSVKTADLLLSPVIRLVRATPVASFIILLLLWVGRKNVPVFISMLMVIPVVWENLVQAAAAVDPKLLEMGRAYAFGPAGLFRHIYLPSVLPALEAGCLTAMGLAWKSGIAAEVLSQPKLAIGTSIYNSKVYLETPELFAWTLTVIVLSILIEHLIRKLIAFIQKKEVRV
ncbi:MAG: ABC transporter permease subunit [Clostridia bacterium]|nr:ABC transporter permease subunit [Clostridia bacterium]MBR0445306.1 ABC transporter permease subunit [Clostridia bacterium]